MKKKSARRKVAKRSSSRRSNSSGSMLSMLMDKKHRPLQGLGLGAVMVLFHSLWGLLALIGGGLMVISALALLIKKMNR